MAIGTNFTDVLMTHAADVGIMSSNFKENPMIPWGDIFVSDLVKAATLLLR